MNRELRLSLDLLRGFRAAARHLSFTRAARELHVTQSAISHEIRILEERLGSALRHSGDVGAAARGTRYAPPAHISDNAG